jgi:hypothetical protein
MEYHRSAHQAQSAFEEATLKLLRDSFYVDNLVTSLNSEKELISFM